MKITSSACACAMAIRRSGHDCFKHTAVLSREQAITATEADAARNLRARPYIAAARLRDSKAR